MPKINKSVSVIGAGVAGLSAAIRIQAAGYNVEIYEKNPLPGGKMYRINEEGYKFDVGPTIVMMPDYYKIVFEDAGVDYRDYIDLIRLDPMMDTYFVDDEYRHYKLGSDLVEFNKILESKGQATAEGFYKFLGDIYERYNIAVNDLIRRPFRSKWDMYNPYMIMQGLKLKTFSSANNMMAKYIPNEDVQQMLAFQTLYIGVSPQNGPSLYNIIPMIELLYGVYMVKGGMQAMADGLAKCFEDIGGKINYGENVEQILIENQRAYGIRTNGREIRSDYVISNADFPYTMKHLVKDDKARGKYTPEYIDKMDYSCSCLVFYWGVDGLYEDLNTHNFVVAKDLDKNLNEIFQGSLIEDPSVYLHIPSKTDPSLAPEGKSGFYLLIPVSDLGTAKYDYDEKTIDHYRQRALDTLENLPGLENIRQAIEREWIYRPVDFRDMFNAYRGATFGLQPTLTQSKCMTCESLYFTGSSTHPGAGVPTAMEGGNICAKELRSDEANDEFKW